MIKKFALRILFVSIFALILSCEPVFAREAKIETKSGEKTITLLDVDISSELMRKKFFWGEKDYSKGITPFSQSIGAVELGMNSVPVLDQGSYGTCVTFATTAAMDAVLGLGDYISQQCSLELTSALGENFWDGAYYASQILDPLKKHGVVEKSKCKPYPSRYASVTLSDYKALSEGSADVTQIKYVYHRYIDVEKVKSAIDAGHRVAIGFGLVANDDPISVQGFDVKVGGEKERGGLWACSQFPSSWSYYCGSAQGGHEVVVTGYDDSQELLKIRNSWGEGVGDEGEYYMTYLFFSNMKFDGTEIW